MLDNSSNPVLESFPESLEGWDELSRLCAQGTPVRFSGIEKLDPVQACILMDFCLHSPEVKGSVEPFSTLLSAIRSKEDVSLRDLVQGTTGTPAAGPEDQPGRTHCQYFPLCHGYGASTASCETWQAIFTRLAAAAEEKDLVEAH